MYVPPAQYKYNCVRVSDDRNNALNFSNPANYAIIKSFSLKISISIKSKSKFTYDGKVDARHTH